MKYDFSNENTCLIIMKHSNHRDVHTHDELYKACMDLHDKYNSVKLYNTLAHYTVYHNLEDIKKETSINDFLRHPGVGKSFANLLAKIHGGDLPLMKWGEYYDKMGWEEEENPVPYNDLFTALWKHSNHNSSLSYRAINALDKQGIHNIMQLKNTIKSKKEALALDNVGKKSADIIWKVITEE